MKKLFPFVVIIVIIVAGVVFYNQKHDDISNNTHTVKKVGYDDGASSSGTVADTEATPKEIFYKQVVYNENESKITDSDLLGFEDIINGNISKYNTDKPGELDVYKLIRGYLYGDTFPDLHTDGLFACLDGKTDYGSLTGEDLLICKGENKYIEDTHTNYYHIKDTLTKFKSIVRGVNIPCDYFLEDNYKFGSSAGPQDIKVTDYLICNKLKNKEFDIHKNYFYLQKACLVKKCDYLDDGGLNKLCKTITCKE